MKYFATFWVFLVIILAGCGKPENLQPDPPAVVPDTTKPVTPTPGYYISIIEKIENLGTSPNDEYRYVDSIGYTSNVATSLSHSVYSPSTRFLFKEQLTYNRVGNVLTVTNISIGNSVSYILDSQSGYVLESYEKLKPPTGITDSNLYRKEIIDYTPEGYLKSSVFNTRTIQLNTSYKTITQISNNWTYTVSGGNIVSTQVVQNRVDSFFNAVTGAYMSREVGQYRYTTNYVFTGDVFQSVDYAPQKRGKANSNALLSETFKVEKSNDGGASWEPWLGNAEAVYTHEIDNGLLRKTTRRKVYGNYTNYVVMYFYNQI